MAKLTKEQLSLATRAYYGALPGIDPAGYHTSSIEKGLEAAAPFLQVPWEEPTDAELQKYAVDVWGCREEDVSQVSYDTNRKLLEWFISKRNASLLPKPVDPRLGKIMKDLVDIHDFGLLGTGSMSFECASKIADRILAALDEVK